MPPDKLCVIPNTIDAAVVSTPGEVVLKRLEKSGRSQLRLLFLSNMIREKGYLDVLDAAALLKAKGLPISMTFVGRWNDKMDRDAFYNRMSSLGVSDVVRHRGAVYDRAAIKALHLESDVLVMPTYYRDEGQPLVIIESLAAGTPVLVTGHASIPEMVMDGREALFVRPRSPEDIAMAAEKLAEPDVWAHASGCARQRFESYFSEEVVRRRWLGLLRT